MMYIKVSKRKSKKSIMVASNGSATCAIGNGIYINVMNSGDKTVYVSTAA